MLGRRILVDVERGRTVKGWKPRRLGGGLGNVRNGAPEKPAPERYSSSYSNDRRDRGYGGSGASRYDGGYRSYSGGGSRSYGGGSRYGDDRRRQRMRSRSPRGYRDRYGGRGRDRSRDRSRRY